MGLFDDNKDDNDKKGFFGDLEDATGVDASFSTDMDFKGLFKDVVNFNKNLESATGVNFDSTEQEFMIDDVGVPKNFVNSKEFLNNAIKTADVVVDNFMDGVEDFKEGVNKIADILKKLNYNDKDMEITENGISASKGTTSIDFLKEDGVVSGLITSFKNGNYEQIFDKFTENPKEIFGELVQKIGDVHGIEDIQEFLKQDKDYEAALKRDIMEK